MTEWAREVYVVQLRDLIQPRDLKEFRHRSLTESRRQVHKASDSALGSWQLCSEIAPKD